MRTIYLSLITSNRCHLLTSFNDDSRIQYTDDDSHPLNAYVQIRSEIVNLTCAIIKLWSPLLYAKMIIYMFEISSTFYNICLTLMDHHVFSSRDSGYFFGLWIWVVFHIIGLIVVVVACDSITNEVFLIRQSLHRQSLVIFHIFSFGCIFYRLIELET